ncbi:MATE family efflux transporter [Cupriavidus basilensis]|uniref:MATE family efflux transporter n=1 Tax=Cupriavidus basilensis TaxID=68895 RepID=UPI0007512A8B|nr:MATE family efflux transporter [Cupriavidus basilensis]
MTTPAASNAPHAASAAANPRLQAMLKGPVLPTVARLAWPNLAMMLAQSSTGLIETWFVSRLGTAPLAGMALVLPVLMLLQNMAGGAMGGGISAAVSRALGGGRHAEASSLALHAVVINAGLGIVSSAALLLAGPYLYRALGGSGAALDAALTYSDIVFAGSVMMWVMNALASVIRGTGNMVTPGAVICGGALLLIPLSPSLIFGWGPMPELGIAGAGVAMLIYYALGAAVLAWYCLSGRNAAKLQRGPLRWPLAMEILSVGGVAAINPFITNTMIGATTAMVGASFGVSALAGYGTGVRLEYLVIPVAFGIGAPLVAMVGSNLGARQPARVRQIALIGGAMSFAVTEAIGLCAAIWPLSWLRLFGTDPGMLATGTTYLRVVGPFYGFFGLGFALYFASQGARRLKWPLLAGLLRLLVAVGGGWLAIHLTGSLVAFFAASALGMVLYGAVIASVFLFGFRETS